MPINAKDLNYQSLITAMATAKSVLKLSDTNCDSKAPNLTLVLKDGRALLPGQDVALLTVLGFAGAVGLTCLGLVIFNWKLQQGKANERISENLCCRTFDESLRAHEARNYHAQGYCNCHLTQENEIKVMSIVGSRKEMPLSQENSHQVALASESTVLDRSFRNLKGRSHGADSTFFCAGGRLLKPACSESPENMAVFNEASLLTRFCPERFENLRNLESGKVQPKTLPQHITTIDISNDTFSRRYATPASALAREGFEKHLTNESWQPPIEKGDNGLQPHRQRHFITSSSSKPCELEECYIQKILEKHRSKYHDPCGLLKQNRPRYFQPSNSLICKYVPCDQFLDYQKEKKPNHREHSKPVREQLQINSAIEKFLMNEDNMKLSNLPTKIKKTYISKIADFHNFDLVEKNGLVMSPKTSTHWKQRKNQSNHTINLDLKKCNNPQEKNQGENWLTDPQIIKKKRTNQSDRKGKIKGRNLKLKLNMHPFRKVRVHPEKILPVLPKKHKHIMLFPNELSKASEKETKINLMTPVDFHRQPESSNYVRLTSKRLALKHATKHTPNYKKNTKKALLLSNSNLSVASQNSVKDKGCHDGHISYGNSSALPQSTLILAKCRNSHTQVSTEQMEGATNLSWEGPSYLPANYKSTAGNILPSHHCREATDKVATEPTQHLEQDKSKTNEQVSWSLGNQIQLLGVHNTGNYKEHTPDKNQAVQQVEQDSSFEILGDKEKTLMTRPQTSHEIACILDKGNDTGSKFLKTESEDFFLVPQTQSKVKLTLMKVNSIQNQNRIELSKDISTSLPTQTTWQLPSKSEKGIDSTEALPRDDGTKALEIKIIGEEEEKTPDKSKANSSTSIQTAQMTLKGTTKEKQQIWEKGKREKDQSCDSSSGETTIIAKDLSVTSSHGTENRVPCSESDVQINKKIHDLRDVQSTQVDKDNREHEEGTFTMELKEASSLLPELKNSIFEAENEVSQISRKNEAENSAPKPILHLLSADDANTSFLEAEQSEQNNSNKIHFLP